MIRWQTFGFSDSHEKRQFTAMLFIVSGVFVISLLSIWYLRHEAMSRIHTTSRNLTKSVEQTIESTINGIDYTLQSTVQELQHQLLTGGIDPKRTNEFLTQQQQLVNYLHLLRATNPEGETQYGDGVDPAQRASLAHRDYYKRLRDNPKLGLVISEPIIGKISQKWIWLMARRINQPDGQFGGLVYGSIFIDDLVKLLESLKLSNGSVISLRDENLAVVARTTFGRVNSLPIGDKTLPPALREALQTNPQEGSYDTSNGDLEGIHRLYSYQRNPKYGFTVFVGVPTSDALDEWNKQAVAILLLNLLFAAGALSFARSNQHAWRLQKESLKALADTQFALDKAGVAIHWVDANSGQLLHINERAAEMLGYTFDEMIKLRVPDLDPNFPPGDFRTMTDIMFASGCAHFESVLRHKNGHHIPIELIGYVFPEQDGIARRFVTFITDISERKAQETSLIAAKEASEAANLAKSRFLANMSHEIRTPMNAIIGMTHILRRNLHAPEQQEKLGKIAGAADHLLCVINDILDISKIEAEKVVLEKTTFELDIVLERVCAIVIDKVHAKHLELVIDADPGIGMVSGDVTRLSQAILNYLGNAIKFTEQGTIILRTRLLEKAEQDLLIRIEVEDNGIGIAPEAMDRLFQSFEQADNSTTRRYGGTGLGLVITKCIAQLMGGDAGAESAIGHGSTFWMTVRLTAVKGETASPLIPQLSGKRALVIDDTPISCLIESQLLRSFGMACDSVSSGDEAIRLVQAAAAANQPYELLLIDLLLPGIDGFETLTNIRACPLTPQPTAWLVTASGETAILDSAPQAGFAKVLQKPVTTTLLHEALLHHFLNHDSDNAVGENTIRHSEDILAMLKARYPTVRLLLVEDEPINQEIAREILMETGWEVETADNGLEAVDRLREGGFDLILMDMQMPVMDGLEATRQIRTLEYGKNLPIIAMTANAFGSDRQACFNAGMTDFLSKPFEPDMLYDIILKQLSARKN